MDENKALEGFLRKEIVYTHDKYGRLTHESHIYHEEPEKEEPERPSEFDGVKWFVDVPNNEVQGYLDLDFYIYKVYQKNTVLMKKEVKETG
jgi:hypothetical protein